ncbi:MAG: hypothetical protein ACT4OM_09960 [Actinomycetota bacterium]
MSGFIGILTFELVAGKREARSEADGIAVRLRICVADATGDWQSLLDRALRGRRGRRQAALVHARHGRSRVWVAEPKADDKSFRLAIDQAFQAGINAEAAEALHSIWTIGGQFGLPDNEWFGAVKLAREVQTAGVPSIFPNEASTWFWNLAPPEISMLPS